MTKAFVQHRWRDSRYIVHHITSDGRDAPRVKWNETWCKYMAYVNTERARTPCGILMYENYFEYTTDAPTCIWCVVQELLGWRHPEWPNEPPA